MILLSNVTVLDPLTSRPVLDAFSLTIEKGALRVILGAGGSGKTTLLQVLTGERTAWSGEVQVNDISVPTLRGRELARYRRGLGLVQQDATLLEHRTVEAQIALPLELEGLSRTRREERVERALERFDLLAVRNKLPESLSKSDEQRVAIAAAVVREPFLLLADEPGAHLDGQRAKEIAELLLHENLRGMTMLIVTSDERFAGFFPAPGVSRMEEGILA
jgi:ABC-type ATPase involved in cell division